MTNSNNHTNQQNIIVPIILIGALFFIFGFVTWLNGILMPYLQIACELTNFQAAFVVFSFYISYTLMALPSQTRTVDQTGFGATDNGHCRWRHFARGLGTTFRCLVGPRSLSDFNSFVPDYFGICTLRVQNHFLEIAEKGTLTLSNSEMQASHLA
jgi:hypothetical protein